MIDNTTIQLQNVINRLQSSGVPLSDDTQQTVFRAQNLIRDVAAARQVLL